MGDRRVSADVYVDEYAHVEREASHRLGQGVFVHSWDYLQDGRVVAYLGNVVPTDTSPWPSQHELSFVGYAPIGAAIAVPQDGGYAVTLPDRDDLHDALQARKRREDGHRKTVVTGLLEQIQTRQALHAEEATTGPIGPDATVADPDAAPWDHFSRGQSIGSSQCLGLADRMLRRRLTDAPTEGTERFAGAIPALLNWSEDRTERHREDATEYGVHDLDDESIDALDLEPLGYLRAGRAVGYEQQASYIERSLRSRLREPIRGDRRWDSPDYEIVRDRRTLDLPAPPEDCEA